MSRSIGMAMLGTALMATAGMAQGERVRFEEKRPRHVDPEDRLFSSGTIGFTDLVSHHSPPEEEVDDLDSDDIALVVLSRVSVDEEEGEDGL